MSCKLATRIAGLCTLIALVLAGCASSDSYLPDRDLPQPLPVNYRPEILSLLKTYLNDPRDVRDAAIAEPVKRKVGGRDRYVVCLRFNARDSDGSYRGSKERGTLFLDGRLDRIIEKPEDMCVGAAYAPFPELEKLTR